VVIGVGITNVREVGRRLRIAQHHPKPDGRMKLKIERATGTVLLRSRGRIGGDGEDGSLIVSGSGPVGIEGDGRLVMSGVLAQRLLILVADVGAKAGVVGAKEQLALDFRVELLSMDSADDSGTQKHE